MAKVHRGKREHDSASAKIWIEELAHHNTQAYAGPRRRQKAQTAATRILEIQKRVKPDPEGWTIRNYIDHGRL